jgi:CRP-like cAMP-binding protein
MDDDRLASIPLLASLSPRARRQFVRDGLVNRYQPGESVVREGDPATRLYLILGGHARVEQAVLGQVATLGPGDYFGELALIDQQARSASVVAQDELECLIVSAWEFRATLKEHPELAIPMLEAAIARLHSSEARVRDAARAADDAPAG